MCRVVHPTYKSPLLVAVHKQPCFVCIHFVFISQCCLDSWGDPICHSCLCWMWSERLDLQMDANVSGVSHLGNCLWEASLILLQRFIGGSWLSSGQVSLTPFVLFECNLQTPTSGFNRTSRRLAIHGTATAMPLSTAALIAFNTVVV